jgi:hypothetical protein
MENRMENWVVELEIVEKHLLRRRSCACASGAAVEVSNWSLFLTVPNTAVDGCQRRLTVAVATLQKEMDSIIVFSYKEMVRDSGKAEPPIHDNIRELITWECKEHGVNIMKVVASPKGSVGHWNRNFWRLEQFYTNF